MGLLGRLNYDRKQYLRLELQPASPHGLQGPSMTMFFLLESFASLSRSPARIFRLVVEP
jgi:hypothetical protein